MQGTETSIFKAAKIVNKLAIIETEQASDTFGPLIDNCNDVLALMAHAN